VGCELDEKERFWSELDEVMESIPMGERVMIGADFNGHVGEGVMRRCWVCHLEGGKKETWWWNEEVQDSIQRKRLAKKKWDMDRTEESRQEYKELQRRVKREVSKAKQKAYDELYTRLDTREGEKDLYRLARQRDRDGKDVQQVRVIKDRDGRVLTSEESVPRRWKEYFEELMNEENERGKKSRRGELRKSGVAERYVRVLQDMYERSRTVMDQLSEEVRQESPWTMMFADDIVICSESREQVEENLERWRFALERRGMKVSRSKTEYICVNEREGSGTVRLQGEEVKKVQEFKYLGSTVQNNGESGKEVKKRVQAGWNGWRKVSGVLCDQKISARIKGKVYRTVVRPAMLYGLETVSLRKRQESELEVAELKMLRFSLGVTRLDRIRNEYTRGTAHVGRLGDKVREARLRWFGHVQRRESEYIGRRMLDMELPGRRQRGRPMYMDGINEDMQLVGASVEDAEDRFFRNTGVVKVSGDRSLRERAMSSCTRLGAVAVRATQGIPGRRVRRSPSFR
ncbi:hypothetical protein QTP70_024152, partial [Hemibagrus guttatus]